MKEVINSFFRMKNYENENIKLFFEKYGKVKNNIFQYIFNVLEKENLEENNEIKNIIYDNKFNNKEKIQKIKKLTLDKFLKNYKKYYDPQELKEKYNLGLIYYQHPFTFRLEFYGNKKELENYTDNFTNLNNDNNINKSINKDNIEDNRIVLLDIDFIIKINIIDEEEWICNTKYAFYLINVIKKLKNPHPKNIDINTDNPDDSDYSLNDDFNLEHLVFITINKYDNGKKKIIDVEADLDISNIYYKIKNSDYNNEYVRYSFPNIEIENINQNEYINNEIFDFFREIDKYTMDKTIIFQDQNDLSNFDKIVSLNNLYISETIRYLYLDLNILNSFSKVMNKRKYLSYYIARIYNCNKNFKRDFEIFVNEILKKINDENFINYFIEKIIEKNNFIVKDMKENVPFYLIFDNIQSEKDYKILEKSISSFSINKVYIYGIIIIDSDFGMKKFISLYNKKYSEIGYYAFYLNSDYVNNNLSDNLKDFFQKIGNEINILKDFIQLIYFKEYINECFDISYNFLMKYIKYIKFDIKPDYNYFLNISNIKFKSEEIKRKFILNYKSILLSYLNNKNDKYIKNLISETNGIFFEKQIIYDILVDKIKQEKKQNLNFEVLNVHSIYCMNFDINKIEINKYKGKNVLLIQESKTGEIYDFGIIIGNLIKLYQISIKKSKEDLLKLNRNLIEVDCKYMINNYLNDIGKYEKFNFGLITSISTFDEYYKHLENLKNKKGKKDNIENTSYYLMKNHCKKYKYELLVYDLFNNKFYIENDSNNQLIEYNNFYEFNFEYKLNIPKLDSIFSLKPKKKSIKYVNKDNFISELNKTKLFKIDNDNKDSLNILGNFEYNQKFLDIKEIEEDNFYLRISENNKEKKKI